MSLKFLLEILKIGWVVANPVAPVPRKKNKNFRKLKLDQNFSVQINLSIGVFSNAVFSENFERVYLETTL